MSGPGDDGQNRRLVLRRRFRARPEAVFRAWTEPARLAAWFGPEGCTARVDALDLRAGGAYRATIVLADGGERPVGGVYREVTPPERLVFTWAWEFDGKPGHETLITLEFHDLGAETELVLRQESFETESDRDAHGEGWRSSFDCLARALTEETLP